MIPCVPEHRAIRDALGARDRERAIRLVEDHLSSAHERMTRTPLEEGDTR
jgi:DNA-binding GntR family transcriptional regulator